MSELTKQQKVYRDYANTLFCDGDRVTVVSAEWDEGQGGCQCGSVGVEYEGLTGTVQSVDDDGDVEVHFTDKHDECFAAFALEQAKDIKEMTVSEISEKLGYEVKIVK